MSAPRRPLGVIFLTLFLDLVGFSLLFPLFAAMMEHYQGQQSGLMLWVLSWLPADAEPYQQAALFGGILMAFYALLQAVFSPIWGSLSDRIGRRKVLIITTAGNLIGYLLWIFANSFALLLIARGINGLMAGNISVATAAVADVTDAKSRTKGMALVGMAFGLGFILGPAIGGFSFELNPFAAGSGWFALHPFSLAAIIASALAMLNLLWIFRKFDETKPVQSAHETSALGNTDSAPRGIRLGWGSLPRGVRGTCWAQLVFTVCFAMMEATLVFLAAQFISYEPEDMAWVFVIMGLTSAFVQGGLVRRLSGKVAPQSIATVGLVVLLLTFALIAWLIPTTESGAALLWLSALLGLGVGLAMPSMNALASLFVTQDHQGRAMGAFRSAGSLGRAIGPLLGALLYFFFAPSSPYVIAAICLMLPIMIIARLPSPAVDPVAVDA